MTALNQTSSTCPPPLLLENTGPFAQGGAWRGCNLLVQFGSGGSDPLSSFAAALTSRQTLVTCLRCAAR